ncbi:MAG: hypothetical protein JXR59_06560, partial [Desulfuromonadaceae bacterium]|nr:hypothetical protein [Desulfuromonadaceae bacterium]
PAQRAWQTTLALSTALEAVPVVLEQEPRLYEATLETLMDLVPSLPDFRHIALVGHNPGLQELGLWLCDDAPLTFPTAAVLMLSLNVASWSDVAPGCATILRYDYPKNHPRR